MTLKPKMKKTRPIMKNKKILKILCKNQSKMKMKKMKIRMKSPEKKSVRLLISHIRKVFELMFYLEGSSAG